EVSRVLIVKISGSAKPAPIFLFSSFLSIAHPSAVSFPIRGILFHFSFFPHPSSTFHPRSVFWRKAAYASASACRVCRAAGGKGSKGCTVTSRPCAAVLTFQMPTIRPSQRIAPGFAAVRQTRSEEHTSELQSRFDLVCR